MKILLYLFCTLMSYTLKASDAWTLEGQIKAKDGCVLPTQLFVSNDKNELLYQVEVPVGGSFSFKLKNQTHYFKAANKEGCESQKEKVREHKNIVLTLSRVKKSLR